MATPVIMPRQGQSVESCIIAKWHKQKGDKVEVGDLLFSYETDKASFDEEAKVSGTFLGTFFEEGEDVPCLINVCVIGNEGESINEFNPNASSAAPVQEEPAKTEVKAEVKAKPAQVDVSNVNATPVIMPRQGQSVESCIIAKWHKKKGDKVEVGDLLFSYETDKASFDEEAKVSGTFLGAFFEEGEDVPCLTNVCVVGEEGANFNVFNPNTSASEEVSTEVKTETVMAVSEVKAETAAPVQINTGSDIKISPRAKNMADKNGIDYRYANPTGPYGRIIERDIIALKESGYAFTTSARDEHMKGEAGSVIAGTGLGGRVTTADLKAGTAPVQAAPAPTVQAPVAADANQPMYDEVKIPNIRKVIAKAMQHSLSSTAQLTLNSSFDATEIMEFRKKLKDSKDRLGLENITINDIILFAVSRTLPSHKELNAHFMGDKMLYFRNVNLGIAVDTERGLMVPTLMNANLKSLNEISKEAKKLVKDCQSGSISPDLLKNASFTITNLGTMGIESFTPVINPPQTGILGVNTIVQRAREVGEEIEFYPAMGLSLTFDHGALDGAPAARFLQDLRNNLENFSALLVK